MSLYGKLKRPGKNGFGYNSTAEEVTKGLNLSGQKWLVTGCNSGLGSETIRVLALRGATVIGAARTPEKAAAAIADLPGEHVALACELSEPAKVRAAVAEVKAGGHVLSGVIANAGVMALPRRTVSHGVEAQLLTNHFGHYLLVTGLLESLSPTARIVMVSSAAHEQTYRQGIRLDDLDAAGGYSSWGAYGQSKLANVLFARQLSKRLQPGQTANSLHPGVIATNLIRHLPSPIRLGWKHIAPALALKSVPQGAATQLYVATHPEAANVTGEYWADCNVARASANGRNDELASALWTKTEEVVASFGS